MTFDVWHIEGYLVRIDTDEVWADTFAHWDTMLSTDEAAAIATATVEALKRVCLEREW